MPGLDRQVQRRIGPPVRVAERRSRGVRVGAGHQRPRPAVDALRARRGRVAVDVHPVGEASQHLLRPITGQVEGLDRRVVLRLGPVRRRRGPRRRRRERRQRHRRPVGVDLRAPLPHARVERPDLQALVVAPEQLVAAVAVDIGQLDRRVLRRIRPPAGVTPARQHERRPTRIRVDRIRLRALGLLRRSHPRQPHRRDQYRRGQDPKRPQASSARHERRTRAPGSRNRLPPHRGRILHDGNAASQGPACLGLSEPPCGLGAPRIKRGRPRHHGRWSASRARARKRWRRECRLSVPVLGVNVGGDCRPWWVVGVVVGAGVVRAGARAYLGPRPGFGVGDVMVDGDCPRGDAVRPLGLCGPSTLGAAAASRGAGRGASG